MSSLSALNVRTRVAWMKFLATRLAGGVIDTLVMIAAYLGAFILRFDFAEPSWGWLAVAKSFITVWFVQFAALLISGTYALAWRRIRALDLPRYLGATLASGAVLTILRFALPSSQLAHMRPPYSITLINTILWSLLLVSVRFVWRGVMDARQNEKKLLRRAEHPLGGARVLELVRNQTVLITGAGGTIGSELVRQGVRNGALRVLMVERGEHALYEIDREMRELGSHRVVIPLLADITDEARMRTILRTYHPSLVLHAAAYKHVPLVEENPREGILNNTLGTWHLGTWCVAEGVPRFVMISTDKAVHPVSAMGISKRLAEVLLLRLNAHQQTVFSCVRFGNVLGSSGSVVPLFREQIARHGPVTVTHPDMRRYFMSVEEAVGLVLETATMGANPKGSIYTLDMGKSVKILDLAEDMIRQAGYKPYVDVPIVFTGIRPGEKLFEQLDVSEKNAYRTEHARIFICKESGPGDAVTAEALLQFIHEPHSSDDILSYLHACVKPTK